MKEYEILATTDDEGEDCFIVVDQGTEEEIETFWTRSEAVEFIERLIHGPSDR